MNGIFGLSPREAEVYSFIIKLDAEWTPKSDLDYKDILSNSNRKLISRECNMNKSNLSRLITDLKEKGLLSLNADGGLEVPEKIALNLKENPIEIVFTLEVEHEGTGQNS
jgi:hypothetical protein